MRIDATQRALVVSTGKNVAWVVLDSEHAPRLAQLRRMSGKRSMPVPGDVVHVRVLEDERTVVERMEARSCSLERRTVEGRSKTMAANVDTMATVTALADPPPRLTNLDQLLAFAELQEIAAMVILTKPDIARGSDRAGIEALYASLGYAVLTINPKRGEGIEGLRSALHGRHVLLCGNSGVGKSSIFRALGGDASIGEVSRHGLGRQTTTTARLYRLADGFLIDSPGVNEFGLGRIAPDELIHGFREMAPLAPRCRFTDCTHLAEPHCAVKAAVEAGTVAASRYESYRRVLEGTAPPPAPDAAAWEPEPPAGLDDDGALW